MKDLLLKLISSCILAILSCLIIIESNIAMQIVIIAIVVCIVKFLIVTILEPDSIWEIIKKFIYLFIALFLGIGIGIDSINFIKCLTLILIIDSLFEFWRFLRNFKLLRKVKEN